MITLIVCVGLCILSAVIIEHFCAIRPYVCGGNKVTNKEFIDKYIENEDCCGIDCNDCILFNRVGSCPDNAKKWKQDHIELWADTKSRLLVNTEIQAHRLLPSSSWVSISFTDENNTCVVTIRRRKKLSDRVDKVRFE